jgi:hypothetical protein
MNTPVIDEKIAPIVSAAVAAGFTAYVPNSYAPRPAKFVYVCLDTSGSYASIQCPTYIFEPAHLDAPIKPSREYGSGVLVDYDGTPEDAVRALRAVCESPTVTVRFIAKRGAPAPVVPNRGPDTIANWGDGYFSVIHPAAPANTED